MAQDVYSSEEEFQAFIAENDAGSPLDDFTRAIMGGGIEMFAGEDPKYLALVTAQLRPPGELASWDEAWGTRAGVCVDCLEKATGYMLKLFIDTGVLVQTG